MLKTFGFPHRFLVPCLAGAARFDREVKSKAQGLAAILRRARSVFARQEQIPSPPEPAAMTAARQGLDATAPPKGTGLMAVCCGCGRVKDRQGRWTEPRPGQVDCDDDFVTHGICGECARRLYPELFGKEI